MVAGASAGGDGYTVGAKIFWTVGGVASGMTGVRDGVSSGMTGVRDGVTSGMTGVVGGVTSGVTGVCRCVPNQFGAPCA